MRRMRIWHISELSILPTTMTKKSAHLYWYNDGFCKPLSHIFTIGCGGNIGTAGDTCNIIVCWALSFALLAHIICCVQWLKTSKRVNMSHRRDQIFPMCTKGETSCTLSNNMFLAWQEDTLLLGLGTSKIPFFATSFNRRFIRFASGWPWRPTESLKYTRTYIKHTSKGRSISFYSSRLGRFHILSPSLSLLLLLPCSFPRF